MRIPAIENLKMHICDARTRRYMDEVLASFYSDNQRSAVVMLYVTVLCDIYYKLCELVNIYNDKEAQKIKDYVENEWSMHPTSPAWESEMPKKCKSVNRILNNCSYAHFGQLQTERNLCAHPILETTENLYNPNSANVQGLIINMMNEILCRPSFLSKSFFDSFTEDIEQSSTLFSNDKKLVDYIKKKYIDKIDNRIEEYVLYKKLWKLVFKITEERCNVNRIHNSAVLEMLYDRNSDFFNRKMQDEQDYYSQNISLENKDCIEKFIFFINYNIEVYKSLSEDFKLRFSQKVETDDQLNAISFCLATDLHQHISKINSGIRVKYALYIYEYIRQNMNDGVAKDFIIRMYGGSTSYDNADIYFDEIISPNLHEFSESQTEALIKVSQNNSQIYDRRKFTSTKCEIKEHMGELNAKFDYSIYDKF